MPYKGEIFGAHQGGEERTWVRIFNPDTHEVGAQLCTDKERRALNDENPDIAAHTAAQIGKVAQEPVDATNAQAVKAAKRWIANT